MKRILLMIVVNLFIAILCCFTVEYIVFEKKISVEGTRWENCLCFWDTYFKDPIKESTKIILDHYLISKNDTLKKPIVLFGCSFTAGVGLKDSEKVQVKLSEYTGRSVYNYGVPGGGLSQAIYKLDMGLHKEIADPEYIIYIFIEYHIHRMYTPTSYFTPLFYFYKYDKNGNLVPQTELDLWWYHSYTLRHFQQKYISDIFLENKYKECTKFLLKHFLKMKELAAEKYPNTKFVILAYDGEEGLSNQRYLKDIEKELKNAGITIIYMNELTNIDLNKKPYILDDGHPSSLAWDTVVPLLAKKLSL